MNSASGKKITLKKTFMLLFTVLFLIAIVLFLFQLGNQSYLASDDFFSQYVLVKKDDSCEYYGLPEDRNQRSKDINRAISVMNLSCPMPTKIYITLAGTGKRWTSLTCSVDEVSCYTNLYKEAE